MLLSLRQFVCVAKFTIRSDVSFFAVRFLSFLCAGCLYQGGTNSQHTNLLGLYTVKGGKKENELRSTLHACILCNSSSLNKNEKFFSPLGSKVVGVLARLNVGFAPACGLTMDCVGRYEPW